MSVIKEYFTQEKTEAKNYVCNLCQKTFVAPATGTTSHLWTHLYRKHRKAYDRLKQEYVDKKSKKGKRPKATSSEADDNKRQCLMCGFMPKRLDASKKEAYVLDVLKFVVADGRPFETTAGVGFQNLCAVITDGAYKPPHPTTLSRKLNDAPCSSLDGVTACVVYTADSIRKFDSKSNRTADSIRTQKRRFAAP